MVKILIILLLTTNINGLAPKKIQFRRQLSVRKSKKFEFTHDKRNIIIFFIVDGIRYPVTLEVDRLGIKTAINVKQALELRFNNVTLQREESIIILNIYLSNEVIIQGTLGTYGGETIKSIVKIIFPYRRTILRMGDVTYHNLAVQKHGKLGKLRKDKNLNFKKIFISTTQELIMFSRVNKKYIDEIENYIEDTYPDKHYRLSYAEIDKYIIYKVEVKDRFFTDEESINIEKTLNEAIEHLRSA